MGKQARARRRPPIRSAVWGTLALLAVLWVGLAPHGRVASAALGPSGDPPAPAPLPWPAENPILDSEEVGYLPGGGTVTAAGDYEYTLPIDVPDGRAGMAPHVALRYSSRGGNQANGVAGVGWSLSFGGSVIERCARTFQIDGTTDTPSFHGADALCLDGQRLVQINAVEPMGDGAEYRALRDSFVRVISHSSGPGSPVGFEAFGKDGTIRVYSPLTAKRLPASQDVQPNGEPSALGAVPVEVTPVWVMTQERDRSGNAVLYQYEVDPATEAPYAFEYRITTIEYTAGVDDKGEIEEAPRRKVVFEYSTPAERPDPIFQYQNGVRRSVSRRLTRIKLMAPNPVLQDTIAQYALAYEVGLERSFLESVHRLDDSGWRRMWERRFEWAHDTRPHFQVVEVPGLAGAFHETAPILFDGDNDGRDDLLIDGKFCRTTGGSPMPFNTCVSGDVTAGIWGRPADINGDGKAEILRKTAAGVAFATWNDATGTFESLAYGIAPNSNLIDADGDSLLDAYTVGPRVNPNVDYYEHEWYLRLNTGNGFAEPVAPMFPAPFTPGRKAIVQDLDGNGRGELHVGFHPGDDPPSECAQQPSPPWDYSAVGLTAGGWLVSNITLPQGSPCRKVLLDVNGDGLKDILVAGEQGPTVRYNTGTRFLPAEPMDGLFYPRLGRHDFEIADLDGDGRDDFVASREAYSYQAADHLPGTYLHLRRKQGYERIDLKAEPYGIAAYDPYDFPPHHENMSPVVKAGDANGDGLVDLIVVIRDRLQNTSKVRVLLQEWEPNDVMVRVWDEHSPEPRETVFYSPFTTETPAPSTCTYPTRCLRGGTVVAREHWIHRQDEPSAVRRTAYEFDDLRMGLRGRGLLGFGKVRAVDVDSFAETITLFDHGTVDDGLYPFAGLPRDVWRITPILKTSPDPAGAVVLPVAGTPITARVSHTHHEHERRFTNGGVTHAVFEVGSRTDEWEQHVLLGDAGLKLVDDDSKTPPRVRHTTRQLDDFGNELFSAAWTEGGQRCETVTVPKNAPATWLLGLPQSTSVTCNKDGLTLPEPRLQTMEHDSRGLLEKVTVEPNHPKLSTVTTYTRNSRGLVKKVTVAATGEPSRKIFIAHDNEGVYPRATWNALGHYQQQILHPAYGVPVLAQDPNGIQVRYRYDGFGRVREIDPDDAAGRVISYQQDATLPWGLRVVEARADGGASQVLSDDRGRTQASAHVGFDGQWIHEKTGTNLFGQLTEDYRPAIGQAPSIKTVTTYDTLGRPVEILEPNGAVTTVVHTMFESVTTDAEGRQSKVTRDVDDRVSKTADRLGTDWVGMTYLYGAFGQLEDAVDPAGNVFHTMYDKLGRRILLDDPDRGVTTWTHNPFGEVESEVDALGDTTIFGRDALGRVTSTAHDVHGITTLTYDGAGKPGEIGRLTGAASPDGVATAYEYDDLGRNTRTVWDLGNKEYDLVRTYDEYSRPETIRYPLVPGREPFVALYGYNDQGFAWRVYDATDPASPQILWEIGSRNEDGLLEQTTTANGFTETRQYDPATGRLGNIEAVKSGTALYAVHYQRDLTGNIRHRDDYAQAAPREETFEYDDLDRLQSWLVDAAGDHRQTKYGYDVLGNLDTINRDGVVETHEHTGAMSGSKLLRPHALSSRTLAGQATSYTYDDRGRQLTGAGRTITWTPFDLPAQITQAGETTTFRYDALGTRVRKERTAAGVLLEGVDTIGGLYERRWMPNAPPQHVFYIHGTDGPVAQVVYSEGAAQAEQTLYLHQEALGSVGLVTDNQGGETERTYFDPFGEKVDVFGGATSPLLGAVKLGFTGHRHDDELALISMKGRMFDPVQKRFLTPDPYVADPLSSQSYNRYAYVMGNPLRYTDPTGFLPEPGDLKRKGASTQPDGGAPAATPIPLHPYVLTAATTIVRARSDDTGNTDPPPPPPVSRAEQESKWTELMKHMAWGAAKRLFQMAPPVALARQMDRSFDIAEMAVKQAANGDWDLAGNTILEIPQDAAESAARILVAPIYAVMAVPAAVRTVMDPQADPEKRGEAAVEAVEGIAVAVTAAAGAARVAGGIAKRPGGFRKGTVQSAWDSAAEGPTGDRLCPTCSRGVNVPPGKGTREAPRDWDVDHQPPWSTRDQAGKTRTEVLDDYNTGTRLECPTCNRSRGARPTE